MPRPAVEALQARLRTATAPFATAGGDLAFPGVALLATGRRS
jgi:hypothetical protein